MWPKTHPIIQALSYIPRVGDAGFEVCFVNPNSQRLYPRQSGVHGLQPTKPMVILKRAVKIIIQDRQTDRQTRQTDRQTGRQIGRQTDQQTGRKSASLMISGEGHFFVSHSFPGRVPTDDR